MWGRPVNQTLREEKQPGLKRKALKKQNPGSIPGNTTSILFPDQDNKRRRQIQPTRLAHPPTDNKE
jgi:hypothetical protein